MPYRPELDYLSTAVGEAEELSSSEPLDSRAGCEDAGPGDSWNTVFVPTRMPWRSFAESLLYHALLIAGVLAWGRWQPHSITQKDPWKDTEILVYPGMSYPDKAAALPKLDTGTPAPHKAQSGDPVLASQPILSVPREPDNRAQTVITPPDIMLRHDVRMPNIVAWTSMPVAPTPAITVLASERTLIAPALTAVTPPPQVDPARRNMPLVPQAAAIAPPPDVKPTAPRNQPILAAAAVPPPPQMEADRRPQGMMNIARAEAVAPAPQLAVDAQRAASPASQAAPGRLLAAVPPPPSLPAGGSANGSAARGRIIALSLNPGAPAATPAGNRRGEFAAGPQGSARGSGRPAVDESAKARANDAGTGGAATIPGLPAGVRVGESDSRKLAAGGNTGRADGTAGGGAGNDPEMLAGITIDRHPIASIAPPRVDTSKRKPAAVSDRTPTEMERAVFGPKRSYQMTLNMPNLNSSGGTWIVHFAELKAGPSAGELFSPLITFKSDPAYPSELQRANVQGTVTLYAIIHSDGSVGDVRVLEGADDRLDRYAKEALARCRFEPAIKDGAPVALEAVVAIPFRARKTF